MDEQGRPDDIPTELAILVSNVQHGTAIALSALLAGYGIGAVIEERANEGEPTWDVLVSAVDLERARRLAPRVEGLSWMSRSAPADSLAPWGESESSPSADKPPAGAPSPGAPQVSAGRLLHIGVFLASLVPFCAKWVGDLPPPRVGGAIDNVIPKGGTRLDDTLPHEALPKQPIPQHADDPLDPPLEPALDGLTELERNREAERALESYGGKFDSQREVVRGVRQSKALSVPDSARVFNPRLISLLPPSEAGLGTVLKAPPTKRQLRAIKASAAAGRLTELWSTELMTERSLLGLISTMSDNQPVVILAHSVDQGATLRLGAGEISVSDLQQQCDYAVVRCIVVSCDSSDLGVGALRFDDAHAMWLDALAASSSDDSLQVADFIGVMRKTLKTRRLRRGLTITFLSGSGGGTLLTLRGRDSDPAR